MIFSKLQANLQESGIVSYQNPSQPEKTLNSLIGKRILVQLAPDKPICLGCQLPQKKILKGYCYRCSISLACCDICILKPELCHFNKGTCREPQWGINNCFQPHVIYLALSSSLKVGITKNPITRWIDQGASAAIVLAEVTSRKDAGLIERYLIENESWNDRTNWRSLVKGLRPASDNNAFIKKQLIEKIPTICEKLAISPLSIIDSTASWQQIIFPVKDYVLRPVSWNLLKDGGLEGTLSGICGQYLLFGQDNKVLNMRNYGGYPLQILEV